MLPSVFYIFRQKKEVSFLAASFLYLLITPWLCRSRYQISLLLHKRSWVQRQRAKTHDNSRFTLVTRLKMITRQQIWTRYQALVLASESDRMSVEIKNDNFATLPESLPSSFCCWPLGRKAFFSHFFFSFSNVNVIIVSRSPGPIFSSLAPLFKCAFNT